MGESRAADPREPAGGLTLRAGLPGALLAAVALLASAHLDAAAATSGKLGAAGGNRICRFGMNATQVTCESSDALFNQGVQDASTWAVVDVLVWPTRAWVAAHGGWDPAMARIRAATTHANRIYAQSDTRIQLRFDVLRDFAYEPTSLQELDNLEPLNMFITRGGDLLLVLADGYESLNEPGCRANHCGVASMHGFAGTDDARAFSNRNRAVVFDVPGVYRSTNAAGQTIFASIATFGTLIAHELGHLMGLDHDVSPGRNPTGRFPYGNGYLAQANNMNIGDAMSGFPPASFFSNPRIQCPNGVPCGDANTADAARSLKETRFEVAAISPTTWRARGFGTGMWFNPREPGQGWSLTQQGETLFAAWFTHDSGGNPMWLVGSALRLRADEGFHGSIYQVRKGLPLDQATGRPAILDDADLVEVGNAVLSFNSPDWAQVSMDLTLEGRRFRVAHGLSRMRFTARSQACGLSVDVSQDRSGLWNRAAEAGWGLFAGHEQDILFGVIMTYDQARAPTWRVASSVARQPDGSFRGVLYRTKGVPYDQVGGPMFRPLDAATNGAETVHNALVSPPQEVGDIVLTYQGANSGLLAYRSDEAQVTKALERYAFSSPPAGCQ